VGRRGVGGGDDHPAGGRIPTPAMAQRGAHRMGGGGDPGGSAPDHGLVAGVAPRPRGGPARRGRVDRTAGLWAGMGGHPSGHPSPGRLPVPGVRGAGASGPGPRCPSPSSVANLPGSGGGPCPGEPDHGVPALPPASGGDARDPQRPLRAGGSPPSPGPRLPDERSGGSEPPGGSGGPPHGRPHPAAL
jgi:hypothetical protein